MNENNEDAELLEMERMLKEIEPTMPVPDPELRDRILSESKEEWNKKNRFPVKFIIAWAALVAIAVVINYSAQSANEPEEAHTGETAEQKNLTEEEYNELKKVLDKTLKGNR